MCPWRLIKRNKIGCYDRYECKHAYRVNSRGAFFHLSLKLPLHFFVMNAFPKKLFMGLFSRNLFFFLRMSGWNEWNRRNFLVFAPFFIIWRFFYLHSMRIYLTLIDDKNLRLAYFVAKIRIAIQLWSLQLKTFATSFQMICSFVVLKNRGCFHTLIWYALSSQHCIKFLWRCTRCCPPQVMMPLPVSDRTIRALCSSKKRVWEILLLLSGIPHHLHPLPQSGEWRVILTTVVEDLK